MYLDQKNSTFSTLFCVLLKKNHFKKTICVPSYIQTNEYVFGDTIPIGETTPSKNTLNHSKIYKKMSKTVKKKKNTNKNKKNTPF